MLTSSSTDKLSSKAILVVDDDEIILEILSRGLENCGFKVFKAENGLDAWNLFIREHIDCVITDIWMPGLKGNDLSRKIRKQSPSTKIALMTGAETEGVTEFLKDGTADYFFRKPFDLQKICSVFITDT